MAIRSKGQNTVITPVALAGKISDRHQFHGSDAEFRQVVEALLQGSKRPFRSEGSHVKLINDRLFPRLSAPILVLPLKTGCIDHLARTVHVLWLKSRSRVRNFRSAVDLEFVASSGGCLVGYQLKPSSCSLHRKRASVPRID